VAGDVDGSFDLTLDGERFVAADFTDDRNVLAENGGGPGGSRSERCGSRHD